MLPRQLSSFKKLQSIDPMDEFKGKTEKEISNFINKYKNMKVTKNTPELEKEIQKLFLLKVFLNIELFYMHNKLPTKKALNKAKILRILIQRLIE